MLSPNVLSRALVCGREMTTFVPVIHIVAGAEKAKGMSEAPALVSIYPRRRVALIEEAHVPFAFILAPTSTAATRSLIQCTLCFNFQVQGGLTHVVADVRHRCALEELWQQLVLPRDSVVPFRQRL